ncbi:MAG: XRE family transcriptional regulator [Candidatus Eisenbacteria bacterium]
MSIVDVTELGRRVRALRLQRGMTLKQVEAACGLSATHLSEVERGRTSPTLGALTRLAAALGRETAYFLEPDELPEVAQLKRNDAPRKTLATGVAATTLTGGIPGSHLTAFELRFEAQGAASCAFAAGECDTEANYLVLEGAVVARVGDDETRLEAGDALQASHGRPHALARAGSALARVLVTTNGTPEVSA